MALHSRISLFALVIATLLPCAACLRSATPDANLAPWVDEAPRPGEAGSSKGATNKDTSPPTPAVELEPVPEAFGTPQSSRAAAPEWWIATRPYGYLPLPPRKYALSKEANDKSVLVDHLVNGALVCEVSSGSFTGDDPIAGGYAATDLTVGASVGGTKAPSRELWVWGVGPEDAGRALVLIPLIDLKKGQSLHFKLMDRDVIVNDDIEFIRVPYEGTVPFSFKGKYGSGTCRFVSKEPIDRAVVPLLQAADEAIAKLGVEDTPDLRRGWLEGHAFAGRSDAEDRVSDAAGLVGWDDPRVQRRLERLEAFAVERQKVLHAALEEAWESSPSLDTFQPVADGVFEFELREPVCGKKALRAFKGAWIGSFPSVDDTQCVLLLAVRNTSDEALSISGVQGHIGLVRRIEWIDLEGKTSGVKFFAIREGKRVRRAPSKELLAPGAEIELAIRMAKDWTPDAHRLIRTSHEVARLPLKGANPVVMASNQLTARVRSLDCDPAEAKAFVAGLPRKVQFRYNAVACVAHVEVDAIVDLPMHPNLSGFGPVRGFTLRSATNDYAAWRGMVVQQYEGSAPVPVERDTVLAKGRHHLVVAFSGTQRDLEPGYLEFQITRQVELFASGKRQERGE